MMAKIHVNNSDYMEFIDEIATQLTEITYTVNDETCYKEVKDGLSDNTCVVFTEEAQDFYNERYDEVETMLNRTLKVYSDEHTRSDN